MHIEVFVCGPINNNTIVIWCEKTKKAAVIDPAFDSFDKVLKFLKKHNLKLEKVLLTHSHWDHIADVKKIKDQLSSQIYVHKADAKNLKNPGSDSLSSVLQIEGVNPDHFLNDNDIIKIGEIELKVIHTPGHTPGCVCFLNEKEKVLFSGDTLFRGSYGRVDLPTSNPKDMIKSLKKLSKLDKDIKVIPGHGKTTTMKDESWVDRIEEFI
ncbi:MAG: MBL fold metallo-hydrolase [Parachlamydiales bacterium]|nr:MBL fold metallo-hydrolase [Parachlamydiales bacterium]